MVKVATAELKNRLSFFLKKVRRGVPVLITDRGMPIAKIVPLEGQADLDQEELLSSLVMEGVVEYDFATQHIGSFEPIGIKDNAASRMVIEDRE